MPIDVQRLEPPTSFIGRTTELHEVDKLLGDSKCRLLTLVGPGGVGKTRLAIAVADRMRATFDHGVYFVALAPLRSVENIITAIVNVLPFQFFNEHDPQQQLLNYLQEKRLLLVLDNFEHLLPGLDIITAILEAAPQIKVLMTSREALKLRQEWLWQVPGLGVPVDATTMIDDYSAVQLFIERAQQVRRDFSLADEPEAVVRICQLVDGLPLALELAASWVKTLSCVAIAKEIERNIDFLETNVRDMPERHRSMRAVFNQSWRLLDANEQQIFQRLSIFRGGFTREAAEAVVGATLPILVALVDKSILYRASSELYAMHELLRQYAEQHLLDTDGIEGARNAHCQYYLDTLGKHEDSLKGSKQLESLKAIETDFENVRAAWTYAVHHKMTVRLQGALEGLYLFCSMRDRPMDNAELFLLAAEVLVPETDEKPLALWAKTMARAGGILKIGGYYGEWQEAKRQIEVGLAVARDNDDRTEMAFCLMRLGDITHRALGPIDSIPYFKESLETFQSGDLFYRARTLSLLGFNCFIAGKVEDATNFSQQAIGILRTIGDKMELPLTLSRYAAIPFLAGKFDEADELFREALQIQQAAGEQMSYALCSAVLAYLRSFAGDFEAAAQLANTSALIATAIEQIVLKPYVLNAVGLIALQEGDYPEARRAFEQCIEIEQDLLIQFITRFGLAATFCMQGQVELALSHSLALLDYAVILKSPLYAIIGASITALALAYMGKHDIALETLAVTLQHPIRFGWLERWLPFVDLMSQLETHFGVNEYTALWKRGEARTLNETVARIRHTLQVPIDEAKAPINATSSGLIEALSGREIEVLQLVARGYSNGEIAAKLYVSVSTVKVHLRNVYGKLHVKNRTQAVARARDLDLL